MRLLPRFPIINEVAENAARFSGFESTFARSASPAQSSTITTICLVLYVALVFGMGHISDMFGRKKVLIGACVAFIVLTVPAFMALNTAQFWPVLIVELAMCATLTANDGTLSSYLTETFPTSVRFTG